MHGVEVLNASSIRTLTAFPKVDIAAAIQSPRHSRALPPLCQGSGRGTILQSLRLSAEASQASLSGLTGNLGAPNE
jgi:hypothetical protein